MPAPLFQWHTDARAFVAGRQFVPQPRTPRHWVPAVPLADAFDGLFSAVGNHPFCVSETPLPDLTILAANQFATLTGGTSGAPKVIARTQASWIASFEINAAQFGYTATDSIAVLGGLSHSLALYGVLEALHLGLDIHALSSLGPAAQVGELRAQRCQIIYATPTQLRLLPSLPPLNDVRLILCGGGAMTPDTRAHIASLCPNADLQVFYGAAETSFVTMSNAHTPEGSVGRAYAGVDLALRDTSADGTGTIWVRSPYMFAEYLQGDSPHTRRDGDWLTVGELGLLDDDGHLFVLGRAGRVFNIADQTIYPEALEAHICALLQVPYCAVLARPNKLRGRQLVAVLAGPEDGTRSRALQESCKSAGLYVPRCVEFIDPFPLLPSGKPDLSQIAGKIGAVL